MLPGGARFVSGSRGGAKLWTLDGALERTFAVDEYGGRWVLCVAALPDGVHFVVGAENEVQLYHVDGTLVHTFKGHTDWLTAMAVTPDGQHIISSAGNEKADEPDALVRVWSVASRSLVSTCGGHDVVNVWPCCLSGLVGAVAAMPDGQRILSGSLDGDVQVWLLDGTLKKSFPKLHFLGSEVENEVTALLALPDNQHALSGSRHSVKLFNVNDGAVLRTFKDHTECLALLPDGLRFVSGSDDGTARIAYHGLAAVYAKSPVDRTVNT